MKIFIYTVIAIVVAAVVAGFFIVGSPYEERLRKLDETRVQNLDFIQSQIIYYWQSKGVLPQKLSDLNDDLRGIQIPKDPETGIDYSYSIEGATKFSLCSNFSSSSTIATSAYPKSVPAPQMYYVGQVNWEHGVGKTCFDRTIDKDFFQPKKI